MDAATDSGVDGRWMSYAELAELRRIDKPSALKLAIRRKWPRRKDDHGIMQVCVPLDWAGPAERVRDSGVDVSTVIRPLEAAISALQVQLDRAEAGRDAAQKRADQADARADRAEAGREVEREPADALRDRLAAAEAAGEQARAEADAARDRAAAADRAARAARRGRGRLARAWRAWWGE